MSMILPNSGTTGTSVASDDVWQVELIGGDEAVDWVTSGVNVERWQKLFDALQCTNPFLSPGFFSVWWNCYAGRAGLYVAVAADQDAQLLALWPMADIDGVITAIGAHQAEYHACLCGDKSVGHFVPEVLDQLLAVQSNRTIRFGYVLPGRFADALSAWCERRTDCRLLIGHRPLLTLDADAIASVLKKKGNRSKLNRLKRRGELDLLRIDTVERFDQYLPEILAAYDLRQGMNNGVCPFVDDAAKFAFHRDWFVRHPEHLRISVLLLDRRPVSLFFGVVLGDALANAIVGHNPAVASYSGSKLHIYLFSAELAAEGMALLDLTPGNDPWKDRFASHDEKVISIEWRAMAAAARLRRRLGEHARSAARLAGLRAEHLQALRLRIERLKTRHRVDAAAGDSAGTAPVLLRRELQTAVAPDPGVDLVVNRLRDLLDIDHHAPEMNRVHYLTALSARIAAGHQFYTVHDGDRLVLCAWLCEADDAGVATWATDSQAVVFDMQCACQDQRSVLLEGALNSLLRYLQTMPRERRWLHVLRPAADKAYQEALERCGFVVCRPHGEAVSLPSLYQPLGAKHFLAVSELT